MNDPVSITKDVFGPDFAVSEVTVDKHYRYITVSNDRAHVSWCYDSREKGLGPDEYRKRAIRVLHDYQEFTKPKETGQ